MGDFDRHENNNNNASKEGETKKMVAVLALGVVLIGVVAFEFMKKSPQSAVGAPVDSANGILPAPVVDADISSAALNVTIAELKNDPTKNLLQPLAATQSTLDQVPRNPFVMSPRWTKALTTEVVAKDPPKQPTDGSPPPPPPPPPPPKGLSAADYKLNTVIKADVMNAIVNGKVVHVGDIVDSARILEIREHSVVLQHMNYSDGPTLEVKMGPK